MVDDASAEHVSEFVDYLWQHLAADEAAARLSGDWRYYAGPSAASLAPDGRVRESRGGEFDAGSAERAAHIARHDPASVVLTAHALRCVIAAHPVVVDGGGACCQTCSVPAPCPTLRALSLMAASRATYQPDWAPPEAVRCGCPLRSDGTMPYVHLDGCWLGVAAPVARWWAGRRPV